LARHRVLLRHNNARQVTAIGNIANNSAQNAQRQRGK